MAISKLERLPLREVWKHEAHDFTQWLEDNEDVLSEAIDRSVEMVQREKKTSGSLSVDLVAKDDSGQAIIIENQLEKSDHDHLGKLITYLTAMEASTAIWIVADPRPEHMAAVNWLNESSSADFFLLKIEAVRIQNSLPAPLLTLIAGPSEEAKSIGREKQEIKVRNQTLLKWWTQLVSLPDVKHHSHITPSKNHWISVGSGVRGVRYDLAVKKLEASAEVYIDRGKGMDEENLRFFDRLLEKRESIEMQFGGKLSWERLDGKRACRIRAGLEGGYNSPEDTWSKIQGRMVEAMNKLVQAIDPHLKKIRL